MAVPERTSGASEWVNQEEYTKVTTSVVKALLPKS